MGTKAEEFCKELAAQPPGFARLHPEDQIKWMTRFLNKHNARIQDAFDGHGQRILFSDGSAVENHFTVPEVWHALPPNRVFLEAYQQ